MSLSSTQKLIEFLQIIGKLKSLTRTGWVLRNVENPECIAGHMYRMGIMAMLIPPSSGLDLHKCLRMALVHDIGECIIGDLTPYCGVPPEEKRLREEAAVLRLSQLVGSTGTDILSLYNEYVAQSSEEAKIIKDIDRLDMLLQAFEYETTEKSPGRLQEFFTSTDGKFTHPWTKELVRELYRQRAASV